MDFSSFLNRFPHYAGVLAALEVIETSTVQTMAVALRRMNQTRVLLLINRAYFEQHPQFFCGILRHELHHVLFGHLSNPKFHRVAYPRVMEAAMELTANEGIEDPMPPDGFSLDEFAELGIASGQSTLERYRILREAVRSGCLSTQQLWRSRSVDSHRPPQGSGLGDVLDAKCDRSSEHNWVGGSGWGLGAPTSRARLESYRERIQLHLAGERGGLDSPLQEGRFPKDLERVLLGAPGRQFLDWPRILALLVAATRRMTPNYLRPSRRFPERVGEIPGRQRRPPKPKILVGIDTSGSMGISELERVAGEIDQLRRHARLVVVECDAAIHRLYPLHSRLATFVGGGDTDFHPVFLEAERDHSLGGLIYFTDGKGARPSSCRLPTLWALTHEHPFLVDFGQVVRLPR